MMPRILRIRRSSASVATANPELPESTQVELRQEEQSAATTTEGAPSADVDVPSTSVKPEEPTDYPVQAIDAGADSPSPSSDLTSVEAEPAPKVIHQTWERVCHAVPKCDGCDKKRGQVGILQRCVSCTWQICRACVEDGKLEQKAKSGHPALHVMNPDDVDWSPATKAEKAAQAKRRKASKAAATATAAAPSPSTTPVKSKTKAAAKSPVKLAAIRGVGLRKIVPKTPENVDARQSQVTADEDQLITAHVEADVFQALNQGNKRPLSPDAHQAVQGPEKYMRAAGPSVTPSRALAPLRFVMEPNPTPRLPPVSHIGLRSLHRDQNARLEAGELQNEASQRLPYPQTSYWPLQFRSQIPHLPTVGAYGSLGRDAPTAQGTYEESSSTQPVAPRYLASSPRTSICHSRVLPLLSEPGHGPPRPAYQDLTTQTRDPYSHTTAHSGNIGCTSTSGNVPALQDYNPARTPTPPPPPPTPHFQPGSSYPTVQELASDLYHDVRQTHRDYPAWPLPTCLLHEISRSWSRGALHHLASSIGPGGAGFDTLTAVAERVTEWLDLRDNWELREWMARERSRFGRG